MFRLGASGRTLAYAAAGFLEGTVAVADREEARGNGHKAKTVRPIAVRPIDGNGTGLVTDGQDRLWIDLNGDGLFDPTAEPFLYSTILNLEGKRFIVRSDELGSRLAIEPLVSAGSLRLAMKGNALRPRPVLVPSSYTRPSWAVIAQSTACQVPGRSCYPSESIDWVL